MSCKEFGCSIEWVDNGPDGCQCYYGCKAFDDCCNDMTQYCDGMAAIENQEREALSQVAAITVFFSIIMFVLVLIMFLWATYTLYTHYKQRGASSGRGAFESSGFILSDSKLMIILSYSAMSFYVLSLFCYLICNGSLGIEYNAKNDTYGNSQIAAIIFWFLGHTIFYLLFMLKLQTFMAKTTYHMRGALQFAAFGSLGGLWLTSLVVMMIWIDEFHRNYHFGAINDEKIIACMVIAFAAHLWFCVCFMLFLSIVLYKVTQNRSTSLINPSSSGRLNKAELSQKIVEYMQRLNVLCGTALFVTIFCMLMWIILMSLESPSHGFLRFCWWLFPINVFFSCLCVFLALNFDPNMNEIYLKLCCLPHLICGKYCMRISTPRSKSFGGQQIRDEDYDDDEEEDDKDRLNGNDDDDDDDDIHGKDEEEEDGISDLSSDENLRGNEGHHLTTSN